MLNFANEVLNKLNENGNYEIKEVVKNNGVKKIGITKIIKTDFGSYAPVAYVDDLYEDGISPSEVADKILEIFDSTTAPSFGWATDVEFIKSHVYPCLENKEKNANASHIKTDFLDLSVSYRVIKDNLSYKLSDKDISTLGIQKRELPKLAKSNAKKVVSITTLDEMFGLPKRENSIHVLTNELKMFGAGLIFSKDVLKKAKESVGDDFYILPSSIHEVLLVPYTFANMNGTVNDLKEMVVSVNATEVSEEEVLSNNVYLYKDGAVSVA